MFSRAHRCRSGRACCGESSSCGQASAWRVSIQRCEWVLLWHADASPRSCGPEFPRRGIECSDRAIELRQHRDRSLGIAVPRCSVLAPGHDAITCRKQVSARTRGTVRVKRTVSVDVVEVHPNNASNYSIELYYSNECHNFGTFNSRAGRWHFAASTFVTQVIIFVTHNLIKRDDCSIGTCNPLPPFYGAMCRDVCSHWPLRPTRPLRLLLTLSTRKKPTQQESLLHAS